MAFHMHLYLTPYVSHQAKHKTRLHNTQDTRVKKLMNQTRRRSAGTQLRWGLHPVQVSSWHLLLTMVKQWRICVMFRDRLGRDFGHSCLFDAASCRRICIWRDGQFTTVCFKTPLEFNQPLPFGLLVIGAGCCQPGGFGDICSYLQCLWLPTSLLEMSHGLTQATSSCSLQSCLALYSQRWDC